MKNRHTSVLSLGFLLALASCWNPQMSPEDSPLLETGDEILIPADIDDLSEVRDSIKVRANRSWSARFESETSWAKISPEESMNLGCYTVERELVVEASLNREKEPRSARIVLSDGVNVKYVNLTQDRIYPRLAIPGAGDLSLIVPEAASYELPVKTNVAWRAELLPGATLPITLSPESGYCSGVLTLEVPENMDLVNEKQATVVVHAEDCNDVVIEVRQRNASPYILFEGGENSAKRESGLFNQIISFKTNSNWTASITANDGFLNPTLSAESGTKDETSLSVLFPPAACFGKIATMTVSLTPENGESVSFTISQDPVLRARIIDPATGKRVDDWPFSSPTSKEVKTSKPSDPSKDPFYQQPGVLTLASGYDIRILSQIGLWRNTSTGLIMGGTGSYLGFPAIEGHRLVSVTYVTAGKPTDLLLSIREEDLSTVVNGGAEVSINENYKTHTWELPDSRPGCGYVMYSSAEGRFYMGDLILRYE
ncbi:MAG: hypothetical protein PUB45_06490 [Bacteroidales bacterium]|nr:hypothetical protein [Bacteroidales bacterium]